MISCAKALEEKFIENISQGRSELTVASSEICEPLKWIDFVADLQYLRKIGKIDYHINRINDTLYAKIHLLKSFVNREVATWTPDKVTLQKLKSFGVPSASVPEAIQSYLTNCSEPSNRGFITFCLKTNPEALNQFRLPEAWRPDKSTTSNLISIGIPPKVIEEFQKQFTTLNGCELQPDWETAFENYAIHLWSYDNRNPKAPNKTVMTLDWEPSEKTSRYIKAQTDITDSELAMKLAEYRIYWYESGTHKASWDTHFKWWLLKYSGLKDSPN